MFLSSNEVKTPSHGNRNDYDYTLYVRTNNRRNAQGCSSDVGLFEINCDRYVFEDYIGIQKKKKKNAAEPVVYFGLFFLGASVLTVNSPVYIIIIDWLSNHNLFQLLPCLLHSYRNWGGSNLWTLIQNILLNLSLKLYMFRHRKPATGRFEIVYSYIETLCIQIVIVRNVFRNSLRKLIISD